jgi:formyl-CoA transferase
MGIAMALFDRARTGEGRWVHTSLLESQIFMLDFQAARYLMKGEVAGQAGNDHPTGTPTGVFPTSDGHMNIAASATRLWLRLCDVLGKPEWKDKPEWSTQIGRTQHRVAVNSAIADITRQKPAAHWWEAFEAAGVPAGPINTIDKVFDDPQVQHLEIAARINMPLFGDTRMVASPLNFAGLSREIRSPTPEPGAHTDEVLGWLGYSRDEMERLRSAGVTRPAAKGREEFAKE